MTDPSLLSQRPYGRPALTSPQLSLPAPPDLTLTPRKGCHNAGTQEKTGNRQSHKAAGPAQLPEVIPGRDGVPWEPAVQAAKIIARVAFRRVSVEITVPLDLDSYHTTLDENETRICAQSFLELDSSHRPALHGELDETGDVLRPRVSPLEHPSGGRWKVQ